MVRSGWTTFGPLVVAFLTGAATASPINHDAEVLSKMVPRAIYIPTNYHAFGDSYAAGIGAGSELGVVHLDGCHRYDQGYPFQLQPYINGKHMDENKVHACTGAKSAAIKQQAIDYLDDSVDMATVSLGGNDVLFSNIVNDCVYRFSGFLSAACDETLGRATRAIEEGLEHEVKDALEEFEKRGTHENFILYVTGYTKFWNDETDQCNEVSWNYFQYNPENGSGDKVTNDLRKKMNDLVDKVNKKLKAVVESFETHQMQFIDYDEEFDTHRFCEDRFTEPQRKDEDRLDLWIHQWYTPDGQLTDNDKYEQIDPWTDIVKDYTRFISDNPGVQVAAPYNESPFDPAIVIAGRLPSSWVKVFHPTKIGHAAIALKVWDSMRFETVSIPGDQGSSNWQDLPDDWVPGDSGNRVGRNFPPTFRLTDGHQSVREVLYRMRDQVCQGICGKVKGDTIPSDLLASQVLSEGDSQPGCEIATKLSAGKELYFSASHSGNNCYQATQRIIDQKFTDGDDRFLDAGWQNGPNDYEFYQLGIRDLNGEGKKHPDLDTDSAHHLGHRHIACKKKADYFYDVYDFRLSEWDDGDWGKSILNNVKSCGLSPTKWRYEDSTGDTSYTFSDGTVSDHWGRFRSVINPGGCIQAHIAHAMDMKGEGLNCAQDLTELDMFA